MAKQGVRAINNEIGKVQTQIDKIDKRMSILNRELSKLQSLKDLYSIDVTKLKDDLKKVK